MRYLTGFHGITEAIRSGGGRMKLYVAKLEDVPRPGPRVRDILALAEKCGLPVQPVDIDYLCSIDPSNKGILLEVEGDVEALPGSLEEALAGISGPAAVMVLDHIEDPQNLGAIVRSADAFGLSFIVVPSRRASPLTEAVVRASAGATAWIPVLVVQNLNDALKTLKKNGFWIYAADMEGDEFGRAELAPRTCFILGNEGSGVSRLLRDNADETVSIPMVGHVESLNVSVSAALCMYEYRKKYPVATGGEQ